MDSRAAPKKVGQLAGVDISGFCCSKLHTIVCAANGDVYSWGIGSGTPSPLICLLPLSAFLSSSRRKRAELQTIVCAANGDVCAWEISSLHSPSSLCSLFLLFPSSLLLMTYFAGGRLGHGDETHRLVPTMIMSLNSCKVVAVACSLVHSAFVTADGHIYSSNSRLPYSSPTLFLTYPFSRLFPPLQLQGGIDLLSLTHSAFVLLTVYSFPLQEFYQAVYFD
jgi:hypothetical protein